MERYARFRDVVRRAMQLNRPLAPIAKRHAPELAYGRHAGPPPRDCRPGAVLVLLYPEPDDWSLVLTVRHGALANHAGQVAFPGGRLEPGESCEVAACREYREEMGVPPPLEILGRLNALYVFASRFHVVPCVAITAEKPVFEPNPVEVADVVTLRLTQLDDDARWVTQTIQRGPFQIQAPGLRVGSKFVWGATGMMLAELRDRLLALGPLRGW